VPSGVVQKLPSTLDSDERRRSVGRLFQMSGPETAKFLRPMVVAGSLLETSDVDVQQA